VSIGTCRASTLHPDAVRPRPRARHGAPARRARRGDRPHHLVRERSLALSVVTGEAGAARPSQPAPPSPPSTRPGTPSSTCPIPPSASAVTSTKPSSLPSAAGPATAPPRSPPKPPTRWPPNRPNEAAPVLVIDEIHLLVRCLLRVSTRQQRFARARLPGPRLTPPRAPFAHRSPRRSSASAA
jgi:hypothetical protein